MEDGESVTTLSLIHISQRNRLSVVDPGRNGNGDAFFLPHTAGAAQCSKCRGTGKLIHSPCKVCGGAGSVRKKKMCIRDRLYTGQVFTL